MIDYATREDRLGTSLDAKRAAANAYLDQHKLSVLRHGYTPTSACKTNVAETWARRMGEGDRG